MSNIVCIDRTGVGTRTLPGNPVPEVVSALESMLEEARAGVLVAFVVGEVYDRGGTITIEADAACRGDIRSDLAAAMLDLQHRGLDLIGYIKE